MKKLGIHPLFLILGVGFFVVGLGMVFFTYILVVILHEMAHFFVARKLGYSMNKIFLLPYGAGISLNQNFVDEKDEILIASAGPLLNFFLAFLTISLWWLFPSVYIHTETFVLANIVTGLINLLPCYPLDGGRILSSFLSKKLNNRKKALKISSIFNFLIVFLFILIFLTDIFKYFTFLLMAIFIFLGHFDGKLQGKYELTNFPLFLSKQKKNGFGNVNIIGVKEDIEIYKIAKLIKKNKFNLVYIFFSNGKTKVLNEVQLEKIFISFPSNAKLNSLFFDKNL